MGKRADVRHRLVVLNGHKVLQANEGDDWSNVRVEKAPGLRPGLYQLSGAQAADKTVSHAGTLLIAVDGLLYQFTTAGVIVHALADFDQPPPVGGSGTIAYGADARASFVRNAEPQPPVSKKRSR
jgi:hypothetical protein